MSLFSWSKTYMTHLSVDEIDAILRKNATFLSIRTRREEQSGKVHVAIQPERERFLSRYSFVPEISLSLHEGKEDTVVDMRLSPSHRDRLLMGIVAGLVCLLGAVFCVCILLSKETRALVALFPLMLCGIFAGYFVGFRMACCEYRERMIRMLGLH